MLAYRGVSKILKGGSDISWFPKKGHKILKGGGGSNDLEDKSCIFRC